MQRTLILLPLALAACQERKVEATNASVGEVAEQVRETGVADTALKPGQWAATIKVNDISAPGIPPAAQQQIRAGIGQTKTMTECLTAERAKKPFERFVEGMNKECRYDHFTMGGGNIDTRLVCSTRGVQRSMTMQGTYTPERYQLQMISSADGATAAQRLNMTMTLDAKRVGDCPNGR